LQKCINLLERRIRELSGEGLAHKGCRLLRGKTESGGMQF